MQIEIREVNSKKDLKTFVYLPEKIHRNHSEWIHPLYIDDLTFFDRKKNRSFLSSEVILCLAWQGSEAVGRVMGIVNTRYNEHKGEKNARFCFLECSNDLAIAQALIGYVSQWAKKLGMTRLVGPLGFSDKEPQGMMVEGFDEQVALATNYNFPWLPEFIGKLGFEKEVDLVSYLMPVDNPANGRMAEIAGRALRNHHFRLLEFNRKKELKPWVVPIFRLINEAYINIYGFVALEEYEMQEYARRYLPVLDPRFVKVVLDADQQVAAFIVSLPEISQGIRNARGRLLPFGWYHIIQASKTTKQLTLLLGGIADRHRGKGLDAILSESLLRSAKEAGLTKIDSHLVLETNRLMRAECERHNGRLHKRYRVFGKTLE